MYHGDFGGTLYQNPNICHSFFVMKNEDSVKRFLDLRKITQDLSEADLFTKTTCTNDLFIKFVYIDTLNPSK